MSSKDRRPDAERVSFRADVVPTARMAAAWYESIPVTGWADVTEGGTVRLTSVTVHAPMRDEGAGITREVWREVGNHLEWIVAEAMRQAGVIDEGEQAEQELRRRRGLDDPIKRREMTGDHLGRVARIYTDAEDQGRSGWRAVQAAFPGRDGGRVGKSTAMRWIRDARAAGLLAERGQ